MHVSFHLNDRNSESGRLVIAILFSLVLHALLLFFIRFAQPSWKIPASQTIPLNVFLEKKATRTPKPAGIPEAVQHSEGKAIIGVQEKNSFPLKMLTAVIHAQVDQPKTKIPKKFIGKKILTINKPAKTTVVESEPDLLVTKSPAPEIHEDEEKPFAPTPSVENPVAKVIPPVEKLVSPEPTLGEKQEKIVFAESAQEKSTVEKPGNAAEEPKIAKIKEPEPVKIEEPKPVKVEEPKPVKVAEPEPVKVEEPKPVKIEEIKPVKAEELKPAKIEEPKSIAAEEPKPIRIEEAKPARIEEHAPANAEGQKPAKTEAAAEPKGRSSEDGKLDVFGAKPLGYAPPSLAQLSIAAIRNLPREENKKIQFGERRKSVGLREQDFRYAMYVEGVRIKLERIGSFNYPAAAARNNQSGTLSIRITIRSDGSLEDFSIVRPSAYEALNAGAERIVRMSAPFSPLPENIRQDTDILSITINWSFSNSRQSFD